MQVSLQTSHEQAVEGGGELDLKWEVSQEDSLVALRSTVLSPSESSKPSNPH